jgi:hypothetical protein
MRNPENMTKCINCTNELNEKSNSSEHFLPHSIGWKSSSKFILCKRCNSNFGTGIDDALFQNFRFICTVLNVYREKGRSLPGLKIYPKKNANYLWLQPGGILTQPKPNDQIKDGI